MNGAHGWETGGGECDPYHITRGNRQEPKLSDMFCLDPWLHKEVNSITAWDRDRERMGRAEVKEKDVNIESNSDALNLR